MKENKKFENNHFYNIFRPFNALANFSFTIIQTIWLLLRDIGAASQFYKRVKI